MTEFVPRDCLSIVAALNETYQDVFGTPHGFPAAKWSAIFSDSRVLRSAKLKHQDADRMKQVIYELQGQLFEGERTACFVGNDGLEDMKPTLFGRQNISQIIATNGKIKPELIGQSYTVFVRPKGYQRSDHLDGFTKSEEVDAAKNNGGRPSTGRDAALIFWGMFPEGIGDIETSWKEALRDVNRQLERLGLKSVAMTAFKENIHKLHPRK